MVDYASQTVALLKEALKTKGLSTDGKKADLVQRLVDHDSNQDELLPIEGQPVKAEDESNQGVAEVTKAPESTVDSAAGTESANAEAKPDDATLTVIQPEPKEEPKVLSPEERKQLAVELLKKKVSRAEKFGDEAGAEAARKDLARVEKFGVEPGTALAREIGLVDRGLNDRKFSGNRKFKGKKFKGKRRN